MRLEKVLRRRDEIAVKRRKSVERYHRAVDLAGLPDYYVHTFRCGHAGGASRDFVLRAVDRGLAEIAFTDHIPLYFLPPEKRDAALAMREDQFDDYVAEVQGLRREFAGKIEVRLGIEADYAEGHEAELEAWLARADCSSGSFSFLL